MTGTTQSGRRVRLRSRLYGFFMVRRHRILAICLILAGAVGAYVLGLKLAYRDIADDKQLVRQLQTESQRLKREIVNQNANLVTLQGRLASVQATLDAIMPSENTYNISPNQSMIVAGGHLTIGLVGSPTNESVIVNINGKQQTVVTGDVINIAPDPSTRCQVKVQSFDMFKALLTASCAAK